MGINIPNPIMTEKLLVLLTQTTEPRTSVGYLPVDPASTKNGGVAKVLPDSITALLGPFALVATSNWADVYCSNQPQHPALNVKEYNITAATFMVALSLGVAFARGPVLFVVRAINPPRFPSSSAVDVALEWHASCCAEEQHIVQ